jgi:hypothetical protein
MKKLPIFGYMETHNIFAVFMNSRGKRFAKISENNTNANKTSSTVFSLRKNVSLYVFPLAKSEIRISGIATFRRHSPPLSTRPAPHTHSHEEERKRQRDL